MSIMKTQMILDEARDEIVAVVIAFVLAQGEVCAVFLCGRS